MAEIDVKEEAQTRQLDDAVIIDRLKQMLAEADLNVTTERNLRKKLEEEFGVDLTAKKQLIRGEVGSILHRSAPASLPGWLCGSGLRALTAAATPSSVAVTHNSCRLRPTSASKSRRRTILKQMRRRPRSQLLERSGR